MFITFCILIVLSKISHINLQLAHPNNDVLYIFPLPYEHINELARENWRWWIAFESYWLSLILWKVDITSFFFYLYSSLFYRCSYQRHSSNVRAKLYSRSLFIKQMVNPIQALMINRLLCMEFDVVKVLWRYDKKNSLTNALLLWILTEGILKKGIFSRTDSVDEFDNLKRYVD